MKFAIRVLCAQLVKISPCSSISPLGFLKKNTAVVQETKILIARSISSIHLDGHSFFLQTHTQPHRQEWVAYGSSEQWHYVGFSRRRARAYYHAWLHQDLPLWRLADGSGSPCSAGRRRHRPDLMGVRAAASGGRPDPATGDEPAR
jgi:hypothetical protein